MAEWQWKRWDVLQRVMAGKVTMPQASEILRLSVRQVRRLRRRAEREGRQAVVHGNRGRPPTHRIAEATRTRIVALRCTTYRDFNDTHFAEKLAAEAPPITVSVRTIRADDRAVPIGPAGLHARARELTALGSGAAPH